MSTSRARLHRSIAASWVAVLTLFGAGALFISIHPVRARDAPIEVRVNGRRIRVPGPTTTVERAVRASRARLAYGALRSVVTNAAIDAKYTPPTFMLDGRPASANGIVRPGGHVAVVPGVDVTEETQTVEERIAPSQPPNVEAVIWYPGVDGAESVVSGVRSGEVVSRRRIREPIGARQELAKVVALTFDDGPDPRWTPQILQILQEENVKATFCVVGHWAEVRPALVLAERDAGMTLCDHTEHHVEHLDQKPRDQVEQEVFGGADAVKRITGADPPLYRAPGGHLGPEVVAVARQRGLRVLHWSVDPSDYRRPEPRPLLDRIMADVRPGSIVLLHDGGGDRSSTVIMLKELIQRLKADGWGFATPTTPPTP